MPDETIIALIRADKSDKALDSLYNFFPPVRKMIRHNGGNSQDAEDIFQEALIILCRKVRDTDFVLTAKLSTWLFSVCRYLWKDELKKRGQPMPGDPETLYAPRGEVMPEEAMEKEHVARLAESVLSELGERCRELLLLYYTQRLKLKEIAVRMGYSSESTAKNQKYKCLEGAKNKMKELKQAAQTF